MRVAVFGVGRMGGLHAALLRELQPDLELVLVDGDAARAASMAREVGGEVVSSEAAVATSDAILIASPPPTHATLVRAGVARGIAVFCEKPLAADLDETIALVDEVETADGRVQVGFQRRFDPAYAEARRRLEQGELGTVHLVRLTADDPLEPREPGAELFRDSSIHDFDLARFLTGQEVEEVHAFGSVRAGRAPAPDADPDTAVVSMRMSGGTLCLLGATLLDPLGYDIRTEVIAERDAVSMGFGPQMPLTSLEPGASLPSDPWQTYLTRFEPAYRLEVADFVTFAAGSGTSRCTPRDGLEAMRVAVAARTSLVERRVVALAEIAGSPARVGAAAAMPGSAA
jgi:myo-inositol 2-dehydrogenase/D-chiro-inositol 1-dehydrogenase